MARVCVFIDGENFRHSIVDAMENDFDKEEYLPKAADWQGFFDWLVVQACGPEAQRLRAYWYVLQHVDFYPYKFPDLATEPDSLGVLLRQNNAYQQRLNGLEGNRLTDEMRRIVENLKSRERRFRGRFEGWQVLQDGIALKHRAVEFRRAGSIRYNLFYSRLGQEKAVDVKLATDLIMLRDIYDIAMLVSGDQDYVPAVQHIKDAGKTVVNVAFSDIRGKLLPGGARRLNNLTDSSLTVPHGVLKQFFAL